MEINIERILIEQKSVLRNLLELYNYEFTDYGSEDVDEHGLYGYMYLDNYWTEDGRYPYMIRVDGKIAGFALIRTVTDSSSATVHIYYNMCEFFVMRKYRHKGVGVSAAFKVFDMHPGEWHIAQMEENRPAQEFWRRVISKYTSGRYEEIREDGWEGPIQVFTSDCDVID